MRAEELMTRDVVAFSGETSVREAAERLLRHGLAAAPVVDSQNVLLGVVTEADLLRGRVVGDPRRHQRAWSQESAPLAHWVTEVMRAPVALPAGADVADAAEVMLTSGTPVVPLVEEGRLVGVLTVHDLLRLLTRDDAAVLADVRDALARSGERQPWSVEVREGDVHLQGAGDPSGALPAVVATVPGVSRVSLDPPAASAVVDRGGMRVLDFDECLRRLGSAKVGRLGFRDRGEVVILPVNHAVDGRTVVFRTAEGSKLLAAETRSAVAFEVDGYETVRRAGWSVLLKGDADLVYDDEEVARLEQLGLDPWADRVARPVWVRVRPNEVSGREVLR